MNDLVRTDTLFGKRVNVIGDISADLVLESLGKLYIKSRNKSQTLEQFISTLVTGDVKEKASKVIITDDVSSVDTTKNEYFVFDKINKVLYLILDNALIELINVAPAGTGYVKRSGDTMVGRLTINVPGGPPLKVNSTELVENLNAEYLNGETSESFTRRAKDETITGKWRFRAPTYFENNTYFGKDIVTTGSLGTPNFVSGFAGYGWRLDSTTNTLTIDNLVVRKLLQVYELVVNKISATNGSLWVTNAGKVKKCQKLIINPNLEYRDGDGLIKGDYFIYMPSDITYTTKNHYDCNGVSYSFQTISTTSRSYMKLVCINTEDNINLQSIGNYYNIEGEEGNTDLIYQSLYDSSFKYDVVFPIVPRGVENDIVYIESYYNYFSKGDFYIVVFDDDSLPVFKPGDILRCQKWTNGGIKSYDAVVCKILANKGKEVVLSDDCTYIIQVAPGILDTRTTISYDDNLEPTIIIEKETDNNNLYQSSLKGRENGQVIQGIIEKDDSLVQMGNLWDVQRQNAVYITSTDDAAPFMDVLTGVNRPDYSVIYNIPKLKTIKLYKTSYDNDTISGYDNLVNPPYTGEYYIQDPDFPNCEYVYFKYNNKKYLGKGRYMPQGAELIYYLNTYPNRNTVLGSSVQSYNILLENGSKLVAENNGEIIQETQDTNSLVTSTKTTKVRLGNLDGIQDDMFPIDKQPYGYGLYGQNVFLTGEFYLSNGTAVADIAKDAIQFAVSIENNMQASLDLLRRDLVQADNLLQQNTYSKQELKTAGMYITGAGIVLWGNKILLATTNDEFQGRVRPTALFQSGKILGKYLQVDEVHSNGLYNAEQIQFINNQATYISCSHIMKQRINDTIYYVRKFSVGSSSVWLYVNVDGTPIINQNSLSYPSYEGLQSNNVEFDNEGFEATLDQLHLWSLEIDGKGNLGGNSFYFDENGKVTVNGVLYSKEGNIAGFAISNNSFYVKKGNMKYEPFIISSTGYGYVNNIIISGEEYSIGSAFRSYENLPIIQMTSQIYENNTYKIDNRLTISPLGIFRGLEGGVKTQIPEVLFVLTVIPVRTGGSNQEYVLYGRLNSLYSIINGVSIYYKEGLYYIVLPDELANFMAKGVKTGQLHFMVTGLSCGYTTSIINPTLQSGWPLTNSTDISFIMGSQSKNGDNEFAQDQRINASIEQLSFNGNQYQFNTRPLSIPFKYDYLVTIRSTDNLSMYRDEEYILTGATSWRKNQNEATINNVKSLIFISTGDDNDADWGGFNLTVFHYGLYRADILGNISVEDTDN